MAARCPASMRRRRFAKRRKRDRIPWRYDQACRTYDRRGISDIRANDGDGASHRLAEHVREALAEGRGQRYDIDRREQGRHFPALAEQHQPVGAAAFCHQRPQCRVARPCAPSNQDKARALLPRANLAAAAKKVA